MAKFTGMPATNRHALHVVRFVIIHELGLRARIDQNNLATSIVLPYQYQARPCRKLCTSSRAATIFFATTEG